MKSSNDCLLTLIVSYSTIVLEIYWNLKIMRTVARYTFAKYWKGFVMSEYNVPLIWKLFNNMMQIAYPIEFIGHLHISF